MNRRLPPTRVRCCTAAGAIPSCANKGILNDLARAQWHFDGYITSDCGAVANVQNDHRSAVRT